MPSENFGRAGGWLVYVTPETAQAQLDERCDVDRRVRYDVEIVGHEAPFKWEVERWLPGASSSTLPTADCRGEADSYEEAMFLAAEAAREAEYKRLHSSTARRETLFDCPVNADFGSQES